MIQKILCLLTGISLLTCACSKNSNNSGDPTGKAQLTLSTETIAVSHERQTVTVEVAANVDWGVSSEAEWCTVSPGGGVAGNSSVRVSFAENTTPDPRSTQLIFRTGSERKAVEVVQNYKVEAVEVADAKFQDYLIEAFDTDKDGVLSTREVAAVTEINASGCGIASMAELNTLFPAITRLDCSKNNLRELNISELTKLTWLDCSGNDLSSLDIQNQQSLTHFDATDNPSLTEIRVWTGFTPGSGFSKPDGAEYIEPEMNIPAGYRLVWNDEFNTPGESSPSTADWWYETGDGGWGNHELQDYVAGGKYNGERLALVSDGTLKIIAKKIDGKVRSVRMNTNKGWTYGYFEARLKLCKGKGTWPAFWMMPKNFTAWPADGEIDIMEEVGYHANYVSSSIHCTAYNHPNNTQKTHEMLIATAQDEFHTYAVEWTADEMIFYFDGKEHFRFRNDGRGDRNTWPFDAPFYLKLNLAWGGDWGGAQGVDEGCLPAVYEADYVRVFQKLD